MKIPLAILLVGLHSLALLPNARGQDEAMTKARASFFQGVELYKEGSFEAALAEFQKAYQITPAYRVLYNIAQAYFELHDYANSYKTLNNYAQQGGTDLSTARRAQIDELNQKLEKRIAHLEIVCGVNDADIRVDDISVGKSPLAAPVLVNAGPRRISAIKSGYPIAARIITLAGGDQGKVRMELTALPEVQPGKFATAPRETSEPAKQTHPTLVSTLPAHAEQRTSWPRKLLIVSLSTAGVCAVATGISGWQLLQAKSDFDREVAKTPYSKPVADSARSRAMTYQYLTYGFGATMLISSGAALYLALTSDEESGQGKRSNTKHSIALLPAVNGLLLHGAW